MTTPPDSTVAQRLADARAAYHRLQTGAQFVRVRQSDGSETEFRPPQLNELKAYVDDLCAESAGVDRRRHGAINFVF
jgi:hypothetical protein